MWQLKNNFCLKRKCLKMFFKVLIGFPILWAWVRTTVRLFRYSHLGTLPSSEEIKNAEQCTICYGDFTSSIKVIFK